MSSPTLVDFQWTLSLTLRVLNCDEYMVVYRWKGQEISINVAELGCTVLHFAQSESDLTLSAPV